MKRFSEQFHTKSKSVTLSATEKQELRERLVSYMEYHPLPAELKSAKQSAVAAKSPILNEAFKTVSFPFALLFKSSAVAAAFVLLVVPFLAEQSVPGDTLYAVKVQFNEEVRSTLTFDSYEKIEWETQRVNRRIAEARLLESEGRLTEAVEAEVAQAVRTHTQNAQKEIQIIREFDAEEATIASIEFDSNLAAQAASLKEHPAETESVVAVATLGRSASSNLIADAVDESRALNEQPNASTTPSYAKLIARVEQNTTRLYELSENVKSLNPETAKKVLRRTQDIDRSVEKAIEKSIENEKEAQDILIDVLQRTQKLIVFMTDLEVSDTVDIQEFIPVVLTNEEEVVEINAYKKDIVQKQAEIKTALSELNNQTNTGFTEKMLVGLNQIDELSTAINQSADFAQIKRQAIEAIELADDLQLALEQNSLAVPVTPPVPTPEPATSTSTASSTIVELPKDEQATTSSSTPGAATTTEAQ